MTKDPDDKKTPKTGAGNEDAGPLEGRPGRDHEPTAEFPPEAQPRGGKGEGRRNAVQREPGDQRKGATPGQKSSRA